MAVWAVIMLLQASNRASQIGCQTCSRAGFRSSTCSVLLHVLQEPPSVPDPSLAWFESPLFVLCHCRQTHVLPAGQWQAVMSGTAAPR